MLRFHTASGLGVHKRIALVRCCYLAGLLSWIFPLGVYADQANTALTLSSAIQRSLAQNPSLQAFKFRDVSLQGQAETANLKPAFELGFEAENFAGSGEAENFDAVELTIALSSVLEMGDKRSARVERVGSDRSVLDAQRKIESLELLGEVTRRYVDVLAVQEELILAREAVKLADNTLDIVKKRASAGATPEFQVKRAYASGEQAKLTLLSTQRRLDYLRISLAVLWGETAPKYSKVSGDLFRFGNDVDFAVLFAKVENNPSILQFAARERLRDAEIRLAKTESRADINWTVGVRRLEEIDDTALVAGFSLPLFSKKRNKGALTSAYAERNQVYLDKEAALLTIHAQLFRAFNNRKQAIVATKALRTTIIPALEQALEETQIFYERGRYGYLELVSARQELLNARRTLIESASAALLFGAEIEQLTAEPLPASRYSEETNFSGTIQ